MLQGWGRDLCPALSPPDLGLLKGQAQGPGWGMLNENGDTTIPT